MNRPIVVSWTVTDRPGAPAHLVDFKAHFQASTDVQGVDMNHFTTARAAPFFLN